MPDWEFPTKEAFGERGRKRPTSRPAGQLISRIGRSIGQYQFDILPTR